MSPATRRPPELSPLPGRVVLILSGGLDSSVLACWLHQQGCRVTAVSMDYGQRHRVEVEYARGVAARLGLPHEVVDLRAVGRLLGGSALTDSTVPVPEGHYADLSMRATVVPHRNALMLDIAVAVAVSTKADAVAFAAHAGDHPIYPDCRPAFVDAYQRMVLVANDGFLVNGFQVLAPFLDLSKADIVALGAKLDAPFTGTWSCYQGGDRHCGVCGTCVERREAFTLAGVPDPTSYRSQDGEVG